MADAPDPHPSPGEGSYRPDVATLRALAHPLRVKMYAYLGQHGAQTATSLAEVMGESTGATSYHLRELAKHGLIQEAPSTGGRQRPWVVAHRGLDLTNFDALATSGDRAIVHAVNLEFLDHNHAQLRDYVRRALTADPDEWARSSRINNATVSLTLDQLQQVADLLTTTLNDFLDAHRDQTGPGLRRIAVRTAVFPIDEAEH